MELVQETPNFVVELGKPSINLSLNTLAQSQHLHIDDQEFKTHSWCNHHAVYKLEQLIKLKVLKIAPYGKFRSKINCVGHLTEHAIKRWTVLVQLESENAYITAFLSLNIDKSIKRPCGSFEDF
jgi:hypothetical protein